MITTRLRNIDTNIEVISLDVLSPDDGLDLLKKLVGESKVSQELEIAKELCEWLGYLPLGIELVGRYIAKKPPDFTLTGMLAQLKQQRLEQEAINPKQKILSTAELGVRAAFELSWLELDDQTQKVAALLSLFAADIFKWKWVESIIQLLNKINTDKNKFKIISFLMPWYLQSSKKICYTEANVSTARDKLYQKYLINAVEELDKYYYKIHPLIREFLQDKLALFDENSDFKRAFVLYFIETARSIPESGALKDITKVKNTIPHLIAIAENLSDIVSNKCVDWAFIGLFKFYYTQGLYTLAEPWCKQCLSVVKSRFGENHFNYMELNKMSTTTTKVIYR